MGNDSSIPPTTDQASGRLNIPVPLPSSKRLTNPVLVADRVPSRQRRYEDLFEGLACLVGIILVILLGIYAHSTTQAVAEDFRQALGTLVRQVLLLPVNFLEGLFVIVAPVMVVISLGRRGRYQSVVEVILAAAVTAVIGWGFTLALPRLPEALVQSLLVTAPNGRVISLDIVIMVLATILTVAGNGSQIRTIKISWFGVWLILVIGIITGIATFPGMIVTVLLGRLFGCIARWILGFDDRRASPADLVKAVLDMGLVPIRIVRCDLSTETEPLETWLVTESDADPDYSTGLVTPALLTEPVAAQAASYEVSMTISSFADRHYQVWTEHGSPLALHVLDPSRAITGTIGDLWNRLRLRGISRWISPTVKANAERAVLTTQTAVSAGVNTPHPLGIATAGDSVALLWQSLPPVAPLLTLESHGIEISDSLLDQAWVQLLGAHRRGVVHRNLDLSTLVVDEGQNWWILDWDQGEVATGEINRHIDCAQMLVHLSLAVGSERALNSARRHINSAELVAASLVMQSAIMPTALRSLLKKTEILDELRESLTADAPTPVGQVAPIKLQRFSPRTVLLLAVGLIAVIVVLGTMKFDEVLTALQDANFWWILAAFAIGATTWVGAAIPLVAFSPVKIRLWDATLTQVAASLATIVAPAGIGPAALNYRFLSKHKIKLPVAIATVTLVQISQFLTSVTLLLIIVVATGTSLNLTIPTTAIIWTVAAVGTILAAILAIPKVRTMIWVKIKPTWEQVYPQLLWIVGHPKELAYAFLGNVLANVGYIGAFAASLAAFGYSLSPMTITVTYLISNTLGSVIPSPGGIGPVEAALTGGLNVAGIPIGVALSTAVIFRVVTFYGRIPFGWLAFRAVQKKDLV